MNSGLDAESPPADGGGTPARRSLASLQRSAIGGGSGAGFRRPWRPWRPGRSGRTPSPGVAHDRKLSWRIAAQRVRDEHRQIRGRIPGLRSGTAAERLAAARELGRLLHDHVRFEERHLFGLLEDRLEADALVALGHAIDESGRGHDVVSGGRRPEAVDLVEAADESLPRESAGAPRAPET